MIMGEDTALAKEPLPHPPIVSIIREDGRNTIHFTGELQSAVTVLGPWEDLVNVVSPYKPASINQGQIYRSHKTALFFSTDSIAELNLRGPFQEHFNLAFAGLPDGIFPPVREKPYFSGSLQMGGLVLPLQIRVRGNSSLQECPFPKLKIKISRKDREGTTFADAREIKIGTHCAEGGQGNIGRLRHETATFREALAYEIMQLLDFIGPRVRRPVINYRDTSAEDTVNNGGWQVTRMAFLMDHVEVVAKRLNGRALEDEETTSLEDAEFDEQLITDLKLFHAMLGNWDYHLSSNGQGLWNTEVIELENGKLYSYASSFRI